LRGCHSHGRQRNARAVGAAFLDIDRRVDSFDNHHDIDDVYDHRVDHDDECRRNDDDHHHYICPDVPCLGQRS
jgi:hypothetical protein